MLWLVALASAQDAITLEAVRKGQVGTSIPQFAMVVNAPLSSLDVKFACGSLQKSWRGAATAGQRVELPLELGAGTHACKGSLSIVAEDGSEGSMPLSFSVQVLPPLQIRLTGGGLDVANRKVELALDRTSSRVEITVLGPKGVELGGGMKPVSAAPNTAITAEWSQSAGDVMKLRIRAFDENGFYSDMELSPWRYSVPHEDVVFGTNLSAIDTTEVPKLEAAMIEVRQVLDKYGSDVVIKLYVGGHTDTVGDPGHNQELSLARARSIASWFKKAGFPGDIFYQGFGERGLAVSTADSVDEPKNRRATYTLAAQSPDMPKDVSGASWVLLR